MCFLLVLLVACSFSSSRHNHRKHELNMTWVQPDCSRLFLLLPVCVSRIFAGPQPATPWGWLTSGPCVIQRGAVLSLRTMVCRQPSPLHTNLVSKVDPLFGKQGKKSNIMFTYINANTDFFLVLTTRAACNCCLNVKRVLSSGLTWLNMHNQCGIWPCHRVLQSLWWQYLAVVYRPGPGAQLDLNSICFVIVGTWCSVFKLVPRFG